MVGGGRVRSGPLLDGARHKAHASFHLPGDVLQELLEHAIDLLVQLLLGRGGVLTGSEIILIDPVHDGGQVLLEGAQGKALVDRYYLLAKLVQERLGQSQ